MSQLADFCRKHRITGHLRVGAPYGADIPEWAGQAWTATVEYDKKRIEVPFFGGGSANPDIVDVVHSLCMDYSYSKMEYREFCEEFGYDPESYYTKNLRKGLRRNAKLVKFLFSEEMIEKINSQEH